MGFCLAEARGSRRSAVRSAPRSGRWTTYPALVGADPERKNMEER